MSGGFHQREEKAGYFLADILYALHFFLFGKYGYGLSESTEQKATAAKNYKYERGGRHLSILQSNFRSEYEGFGYHAAYSDYTVTQTANVAFMYVLSRLSTIKALREAAWHL